MPIEIHTEVTVREIGSQKGFELVFKSEVQSEEFSKWINSIIQLPATGESKIRPILQARNEEKEQTSLQTALFNAVLNQPSVSDELGVNEPLDPEFVEHCESLFGEVPDGPPDDINDVMDVQESLPQPTQADRLAAEAINIFDGTPITSDAEMGTNGVGMLIQAAIDTIGLDFDSAKAAVRKVLVNDFKVVYDEANQAVHGLTEGKYLNALARIQKRGQQ